MAFSSIAFPNAGQCLRHAMDVANQHRAHDRNEREQHDCSDQTAEPSVSRVRTRRGPGTGKPTVPRARRHGKDWKRFDLHIRARCARIAEQTAFLSCRSYCSGLAPVGGRRRRRHRTSRRRQSPGRPPSDSTGPKSGRSTRAAGVMSGPTHLHDRTARRTRASPMVSRWCSLRDGSGGAARVSAGLAAGGSATPRKGWKGRCTDFAAERLSRLASPLPQPLETKPVNLGLQ